MRPEQDPAATAEERSFTFEPEITCKAAHAGCRICDLPVLTWSAPVEEGKKIGWPDALIAMAPIIYYRLWIRT
jgi:hypothetical protein